MQSLRLVLIAHRFEKNDGQGRVNYEVARRAAAAGHEVILLTAHCATELVATSGVKVVFVGNEKLPTQLLRDLAFARDTSAWIRRHRDNVDVIQANGFTTWERCDVVTAHFVHTAWAASSWYPFRGSWRPHALYQRLFTGVNSVCERYIFRRADRVIAVSDAVAAEVGRLGVAKSKLHVIYNGVDVEEFCPGRSERGEFGLPDGVPMALFVGDIRTTRKNLDTTLLALKRLPEVHLAVAGDLQGSPFPAMAAELGVSARVHFLGKTKAIARLMRSVDLFVFPSRYEAHPLVVLEAMSSALPSVIAATVGSVSSFRDCFSVLENPDDAVGLADAMQAVLNDEPLRKSLGETARSRALGMSWDSTAAQYLEAYRNIGRGRSATWSVDRMALGVDAGR